MLEYEPMSGLLKPPSVSENNFLEEAKRAFSQNSFDSVSGFDILEKIGQGGFAVVYLARQTSLNRLVALKISPFSPNLKRQARFQKESEILAKLNHPNVVAVFECGSAGRHYYFASEYCAGGSLARLIAGQVVPPLESAHLVQSVALTMFEVHQQGIIHRDLKPGNLLIAGESTTSWRSLKIKVADFGLAHDEDGDDQTETGDSLGTPQYVAPEQLKNAKCATASADIYSLGAVLYELITGRPPHLAATLPEIILQVERADVVAPRKLVAQIPKDLENICLNCLQKEQADRYGSMKELADDLGRFTRGEPVYARPISTIRRAWRWGRKHPAIAALGFVSALLAFLFAALGVSYWRQSSLVEHQHEISNSQTYLRLLTDVRNRAIKKTNGWREQNVQALQKANLINTPLKEIATLRNEMANTLIGYDLGQELKYVSDLGEVFCTAGHPTKSILAIGYSKAADFEIKVRQGDVIVDLVNSNDRKLVQRIRWPAHPGPFGELIKKDWDGIRSVAFSPDGRWLYIGTRAGRLYRHELDSNQQPELLHSFPEAVCTIIVAPDGQRLFMLCNFLPYRKTLWHLEARLGGKTGQWIAPSSISSIAVGLDGKYLFCTTNNTLQVIDSTDFHTISSIQTNCSSNCCTSSSDVLAVLTFDHYGLHPENRDSSINQSSQSINSQAQLSLFCIPSLIPIKTIRLSNIDLQSHTYAILSFLPDGIHIAVFLQAMGYVAIYDIASGLEVARVDVSEVNSSMSSVPSTGQLAVAVSNGASFFTPAPPLVQPSPFNHQVLINAKMSRDGRTFATLDASTVQVHQREQRRTYPLRSFSTTTSNYRDGKLQTQSFIDLSTKGDAVAWHYVHTRELSQWRRDNSRAPIVELYLALACINYDSDGHLYCVTDNEIRLVPDQLQPVRTAWRMPSNGQSGIYELNAIAVGKERFVASTRTGKVFCLRRANDALLKQVGSWQVENDDIIHLSVCLQDEAIILATRSGCLELRDCQNGTLLDQFGEKLKSVSNLDVISNGLCAVGGQDGTLNLFDISSRSIKPLLALQFPTPIKRVCLTEDGKELMIFFTGDHIVRVLDIASLRSILGSNHLGW